MRDYFNELIESHSESTSPLPLQSSRDYANELVEERVPVAKHWEETDEISAITTKPIKKFTGRGGHGASFKAHAQAGFIDDPLTKVRIYAADRFPLLPEEEALSRYKIQDGDVIYKDLDGLWRRETPDLLPWKMKRFLGDMVGHSPSIALGTAGAILGGPGLAGFGAAGGEGWRKAIAALAFGEPQHALLNIAKMAEEGGFAVLGELGGRLVITGSHKGLAVAGGKKGRTIRKVMQSEFPHVDFKKAAKKQAFYKEKFGVNLWDAQTTGSRRLLDKLNRFADMPDTSDIILAAKEIQDEQAYNAVRNFWDNLTLAADPYATGHKLTATAKKSVDRLIGKRMALAKPYYDKAFSRNTKIDITPHLIELNQMIKQWPVHSAESKKLKGFYKLLLREYKLPGLKKGQTVLVPENRIRFLDRIKKTTDSYLRPKVGEPSVTREVKRDIRKIKNNILVDLDMANPDYAKARRLWGDSTEEITQLTNKTTLGSIADLEGDQVASATKKLFTAGYASPEIMAKIRTRMVKEDPVAWNKALRTHLEGIFNSIPEATGGEAAKVFNGFWRATVGNPVRRKALKAAMSKQQFQNLEDFADMLRKVGMVGGRKESATAARLQAKQDEEWFGKSRIIAAATRPLMTYQRLIGDKANEMLATRARIQLAEALVSPQSTKHIRRIKVLGPTTQKGIRAMSTFLSLVIGNEFERKRINYPEEAMVMEE
jgi:hypothetical protein